MFLAFDHSLQPSPRQKKQKCQKSDKSGLKSVKHCLKRFSRVKFSCYTKFKIRLKMVNVAKNGFWLWVKTSTYVVSVLFVSNVGGSM